MITTNYNVGASAAPPSPVKPDPSTPSDMKNALRRFALGATEGMATARMADPATLVTSGLVGGLSASRIGDNVRSTLAPAAATGAAGLPAVPPGQQDNIGQASLAAVDNLGKPLAAGVRRYNMDPGNEAQVYVTRGKDGSTVFTDNAKYAAANSAGGLRRGDVPADVLARTQGDRNGFEYAKSTLAQKGLDRSQFSALDPAKARDAYLTAMDGAKAQSGFNEEQALANRNDANLLRGRFQDTGGEGGAPAGGGAGGLSDAAIARLPPAQQIAAISARTREAQGNTRLTIAQQQLSVAQAAAERQQAAENRQEFNSTLSQLNDPKLAATAMTTLVSKVNGHKGDFDKWINTQDGQLTTNALLKYGFIPGAQNATSTGSIGDTTAVPQLRYRDLNMEGGQFNGMRRDDTGEAVYPANKGALSRFLTGGRSVFGPANNYDPSISLLDPDLLKRLQKRDADTAQGK